MFGTGYVGLVTGACFAEYGNQVYCIDILEERIQKLKQGRIPNYEPGLEEMVQRNIQRDRLYFTTDLVEPLQQSELVFLTIGTPSDDQGHADLSGIFAMAEQIGKHMNSYCLIITKSTVPVGSTSQIRDIISKHTEHDFDVASNPEFLREGHALEDFMKPERIVIGVDSLRARVKLEQLYYPFTKNDATILCMSPHSAELVKYACNTFLAMKISFANEMANLCDIVGADYKDIRRGLGTDKRIGEQYLAAGLGYGGSCLPKDVRALACTAKERGYSLPILEEIERINEHQKLRIVELLKEHFKTDDFVGYEFAVWGLAFKPDTDDMREAPSLCIIRTLLKAGASVRVNDPAAHNTAHELLGDTVEYTEMYTALEGADALLILTEWPVYQEPDFKQMKALLKRALIFDGRNIYQPDYLRGLGFTYYGIGINFQELYNTLKTVST